MGAYPVSYTHLDVYKRQVQQVVRQTRARIVDGITDSAGKMCIRDRPMAGHSNATMAESGLFHVPVPPGGRSQDISAREVERIAISTVWP